MLWFLFSMMVMMEHYTTTFASLNESLGRDDDATDCDKPGRTPIPHIAIRRRYSGPRQYYFKKKGETSHRCFVGQHFEDLYLFQHFLHKTHGGTFVELGALDGYSYSATYFFERYMGWKGLLIEASPYNVRAFYRKTQKKAQTRRKRTTTFVHTAICASPRNVTYVGTSGTGAGILEFMSEKQQRQYSNEEKVVIPCKPLRDVLQDNRVSHVDLFILDVEGAEFEILRGFDPQATPVHFFVVEQDGHNPKKDDMVRCYLRRYGFEYLGTLFLNEIWRNTKYSKTLLTRTTREGQLPRQCFESPDDMRFLQPLDGDVTSQESSAASSTTLEVMEEVGGSLVETSTQSMTMTYIVTLGVMALLIAIGFGSRRRRRT